MIFPDALPRIKSFLRPARLAATTQALPVRLLAAFCHHPGRMSRAAAAQAARADARRRARLARFLARAGWSRDWSPLDACAGLLLKREARAGGARVFVLDQTCVGQRGRKAENTFSCGNRTRRPRKGRRYRRRQLARRSCHGFVMGLLLSPAGLRVPSCRCCHTKGHCAARGLACKTRVELAAELVGAPAVPAGADVVVPGDTAFEARAVRAACAARGFGRVAPVNPERVPAGPKPRPEVRSLPEGPSASTTGPYGSRRAGAPTPRGSGRRAAGSAPGPRRASSTRTRGGGRSTTWATCCWSTPATSSRGRAGRWPCRKS